MDLWVRSQNRRILSKVSYLQEHFGNGKYGVYDETIPMGYYETEERALEVLDEIQNLLIPKVTINTFNIEKNDLLDNNQYLTFKNKDFSIKQFETYVYQMPKK